MKLSLRWIFDHLNTNWKDYPVADIVSKFNMSVAEIEHVEKIELNLDSYALVTVLTIGQETIEIKCPEWQITEQMPLRTDAVKGGVYVIKKNNNKYAWATLADWHSNTREGLIPAVHCPTNELLNGEWKKDFESEDYVIDVDNKSITNRPDLWGHRGIAREIAALYDLELKSEKELFASLPVVKVAIQDTQKMEHFKASQHTPASVNLSTHNCSRVSISAITSIEFQASSLWMAARLARIDSRPINFLVDATNYVMFDIGQPMHAFDAAHFKTNILEVRMAHQGEKLVSLDGVDLELTDQDLVITDGKTPASLAGIKGGIASGVSHDTNSLIVEAACFDPGIIRLSAARHKLRTEASTRFEKTLDPQQTINALLRYVHLLQQEKIAFKGALELISVGEFLDPIVITIKHEFIESRLGINIAQEVIVKLLQSIACEVYVETINTQNELLYHVTVPSFRSSKDIKIQEDLVEEIGRLYGYNKIPALLPLMSLKPLVQEEENRVLLIKKYLSSGIVAMQEVQQYALFDNDFMQKIGWPVVNGLKLRNPLTVQSDTMVTSLVPNLLKTVQQNAPNASELRFFEVAKIFHKDGQKVKERNSLAGIFFKKSSLDFYYYKTYLEGLFDALGIIVTWKKSDKNLPWASKYQTADLHVGSDYLGSAGVASLHLMAQLTQGSAFVFECDGDLLLSYKVKDALFKELPLYQATHLDISVMVPVSVTVSELIKAISSADIRIFEVEFVDQFQKPEWLSEKSITMRFGLRDEHKSLSKEDIDAGFIAVTQALKTVDAQVRS